MSDLLIELKSFFDAGGFVMPPLIFATTLMWYGLGYRCWILRRNGKFSARQLVQRSLSGWDKKPTDIVEEAALIGVQLKNRGVSDLRRYLDREFYQYEKEIVRFGAMINTVIATAPLMGLLGTVAGMIETFDSLAEMALFTQSGGIAGGISQALFTTQMGLVVAVPGLLIKSAQDRKQRRIQAELAQVKDLLCISAH